MATRSSRGRYTADIEGDFVVFLIGMRINSFRKVRKWWPVFSAMRPMLKAQEEHPELGVLDTRQAILSPRDAADHPVSGAASTQLEHFAREDMLHTEPWKTYFKVVGASSGDVGIWHETFQVAPASTSRVYGNMPRFGLANAGEHRGLGSASRARERISARLAGGGQLRSRRRRCRAPRVELAPSGARRPPSRSAARARRPRHEAVAQRVVGRAGARSSRRGARRRRR